MQYEDTVRIATPEGVEIELALAGIGSRLAARLIDHLLQGIAIFVSVAILAASLEDSDLSSALVAILGILLGFAILWGYDVLFEAFNSGRTPGKRAMGLRVVGERGEPISFSMAAVRNVLRLVDEYLTLWLAALAAMVRSRRSQRLGDMAAGALVVKERSEGSAADAGVSISSLNRLETAASWDTTRVTDDDLATARRFLERRYQLDVQARARLANEVAERLRPKVQGEQGGGAEQFLELLVAVKSRRG